MIGLGMGCDLSQSTTFIPGVLLILLGKRTLLSLFGGDLVRDKTGTNGSIFITGAQLV